MKEREAHGMSPSRPLGSGKRPTSQATRHPRNDFSGLRRRSRLSRPSSKGQLNQRFLLPKT